jgi:hypothetical protein
VPCRRPDWLRLFSPHVSCPAGWRESERARGREKSPLLGKPSVSFRAKQNYFAWNVCLSLSLEVLIRAMNRDVTNECPIVSCETHVRRIETGRHMCQALVGRRRCSAWTSPPGQSISRSPPASSPAISGGIFTERSASYISPPIVIVSRYDRRLRLHPKGTYLPRQVSKPARRSVISVGNNSSPLDIFCSRASCPSQEQGPPQGKVPSARKCHMRGKKV